MAAPNDPWINPWKAESRNVGTGARASALAAKRVALRSARRSLRLDDPTDNLGRMGIRGELARVERELRDLRAARERTGPPSRPGRPVRPKRRPASARKVTVSDQ